MYDEKFQDCPLTFYRLDKYYEWSTIQETLNYTTYAIT